MNVLARVRPDAVLHVHGAVQGPTLAVAVEIPAAAAAEWRDGGDIAVTATDAQGAEFTGTAVLAPGARGAEVRLLVGTGRRGPWRVRAKASHAARAIEDHARLDPGDALFGEPLLYRAAPPPAAPLRAVADPQFWRNERLRAEWMLPGLTGDYTLKARLLQASGQPLSYEPPVTATQADDGVQVRLDLLLSPFAAADYLIELTATRDGEEHRTLQAIRVLR